MEPSWNLRGTFVEPSWNPARNPRGTLPQGRPGPRSLSGPIDPKAFSWGKKQIPLPPSPTVRCPTREVNRAPRQRRFLATKKALAQRGVEPTGAERAPGSERRARGGSLMKWVWVPPKHHPQRGTRKKEGAPNSDPKWIRVKMKPSAKMQVLVFKFPCTRVPLRVVTSLFF